MVRCGACGLVGTDVEHEEAGLVLLVAQLLVTVLVSVAGDAQHGAVYRHRISGTSSPHLRNYSLR